MNTTTSTERNTFQEHRRHEARLITTVLAVLGGIGFTAAVVPVVENAITTGLLVAAAVLVLVLAARFGLRTLRHRREDHADALAADRWRATHAPHLLADREVVTAGRRAA
jgi:uncharacterized membrane protein YqjE